MGINVYLQYFSSWENYLSKRENNFSSGENYLSRKDNIYPQRKNIFQVR
jgi:hypothetical protein